MNVRVKQRAEILKITESATVIALSLLLGNLRLLELPNGGSISLAMVPLAAFALLNDVRTVFITTFCAGLAHAAFGGTIVHPVQLFLDYSAFYVVLTVLSFISKPSKLKITTYMTIIGSIQLLITSFSGVIFFGSNMSIGAAWSYSLIYNASTIIPETIITILLIPGMIKAMRRPFSFNLDNTNIVKHSPRYVQEKTVEKPVFLANKIDRKKLIQRPAPFS